MKTIGIDGSRRIETTRRRAPAAVSGREFADHLQPASVAETGPVVAPSGVVAIDVLLALQDVANDPDQETRKRAIRHGQDVLDQLDALRWDILAGQVPRERLQVMSDLLQSRIERSADPRLSAILEEIQLRAEVELAKLDRSL